MRLVVPAQTFNVAWPISSVMAAPLLPSLQWVVWELAQCYVFVTVLHSIDEIGTSIIAVKTLRPFVPLMKLFFHEALQSRQTIGFYVDHELCNERDCQGNSCQVQHVCWNVRCLVERAHTGKSATWERLPYLLLTFEDYEGEVEWTSS